MLDGLVTSVAALLAVGIEPGARAALVAGQCSREQAHQLVLTELGLEPLLDLRIRAGEGVVVCWPRGAPRVRDAAPRYRCGWAYADERLVSHGRPFKSGSP